MKYIKLFKQHSEYETYINSSDKKLPNLSYCEDVNDVHFNPLTWADTYFTISLLETSTISFSYNDVNYGVFSGNDLQYSIDKGTTWETLEFDSTISYVSISNVPAGTNILFKCENPTITTSLGIGNFSSTGNFEVKGNIMSLLYGDNFINQKDLTEKNYVFYKLFYQCTKLIQANNLILPATTLAPTCYGSMFSGCTSLTTVPELPATTLVNNCYSYMFSGCTSLTKTPELPATTLANYCYSYMFYNCTALTTVSELPATVVKNYCYDSMFYGCTSLTTAPELPATTLTSGNSCYQYMFSGCTSLNYIKAMFTTTPSNTYTQNWVYNVSSTGTFVKNANATWTTTGTNGVPTGWTVETATP